jgi:septum formation protein
MLVLASSSERRVQILKNLGLDFVQCTPDIVEISDGDFVFRAVQNALNKARCCATQYPGDVVLGYDTLVVVDNTVLEKTEDSAVAKKYLMLLSGRSHIVITGIAIIAPKRKIEYTAHEITRVWFKKLDTAEISWYLDSGEWKGKAGGYAIQGKAGMFIEKIEGCYYNVVGLPVHRTYEILKELQILQF